jgi:uncharacterized protein (DUF3084 family)
MIEFGTVATSTGIMALIQFGFYLLLRRPLDRVDNLESEVKELRDQDMVEIKTTQKDDGLKRKAIYERLEKIELNYRQNSDCLRMHQDFVRMHEQSIDIIRRLEQVATVSADLIKRMDAITAEQVSLGKDMADLAARVDERK